VHGVCVGVSMASLVRPFSGGDQKCKKMVFLAAIREKSQRGVALSCDAHLVSAG